ncbi:chorismate mutase [Prescottella equi]|uniref:chorismate mutase n=1 Tax=Rhodococcus hoagii TaxID=43767 RepID=UPI0035576239
MSAPGDLRPLVRLIAQRLSMADPVAAAKWGTDRPIDDPARERDVLRSVGEQAPRPDRGKQRAPARPLRLLAAGADRRP